MGEQEGKKTPNTPELVTVQGKELSWIQIWSRKFYSKQDKECSQEGKRSQDSKM